MLITGQDDAQFNVHLITRYKRRHNLVFPITEIKLLQQQKNRGTRTSRTNTAGEQTNTGTPARKQIRETPASPSLTDVLMQLTSLQPIYLCTALKYLLGARLEQLLRIDVAGFGGISCLGAENRGSGATERLCVCAIPNARFPQTTQLSAS